MIGVKQHSMVTIFDSSQLQNVNGQQRISVQRSMASDVRRNLTNTLRENEDRKRVSIQP